MSRPHPTVVRLFRGGLLAWLAGWFVLGHLLGPYFLFTIHRWPVWQPFFPWPFGEPAVATAAYVAPVALLGLLVRPTVAAMRVAGLVATACAAVLLLHGDAHNDATFLVAFWMGLWLTWLGRRAAHADASIVAEASALLVAIGAFLFLGGVVGKLHRAWWNGEVMAHVLVEQRSFWFYPWLRSHLGPDAQLAIACWTSRLGLLFEIVAVATPLLPLGWALAMLVAACLGVVACAGWTLLSVLGAPIGTALVCLWLLRDRSGLS